MKYLKLFLKYGPLLLLAVLADVYSYVVKLCSKYHPIVSAHLGKQLDKALEWCDS